VRLIFVESICTDTKLLLRNYMLKASNEDYKGSAPAVALQDFLARVRNYEAVYQTITDAEGPEEEEDETFHRLEGDRRISSTVDDLSPRGDGEAAEPLPPRRGSSSQRSSARPLVRQGSLGFGLRPSAPHEQEEVLRYIQIIDAGKKLVACRADGYVLSKVMALLHSIHLGPRTIWIALAGQTLNDERGVLGGDTPLSRAGLVYSEAVCAFVAARERSSELRERGCAGHAIVTTGTLRRYE